MNDVAESLFQSFEILADKKLSQLQFDKTIKAVIAKVVDVDTGEYKVKYKGNTFSAFAKDKEIYSEDNMVYVTVPEGDFSNKKIISGLISDKSLSERQMTALQNSIIEASPQFNILYGGSLYKNSQNSGDGWGLIAGIFNDPEKKENYINIKKYPDKYNPNDFHGLFQQYANNYEFIRIQADFKTQFQSEHDKGNYGLEIEFYTNSNEETEKTPTVKYTLDFGSFNGDPYRYNYFSTQSAIIKAQKNFLLGVKSIKFFEKDFAIDEVITGYEQENDVVVVKKEKNTTKPNIFVKNISLQYVERQDLSDTTYHLVIAAPNGTAISPSTQEVVLQGRLIYQGKDIMEDDTCENQWYKRNLGIMVGDEKYNKDAGPGWEPIEGKTKSVLSPIVSDDSSAENVEKVIYQQKYKLITTYNKKIVLSAETEVVNYNNSLKYKYKLEQETNGAEIKLKIVNLINNGEELKGDWYRYHPDGTYLKINKDPENSIEISQFLNYSSTTFYCQIYAPNGSNDIIGIAEFTVTSSQSENDLNISYIGEDTFRYDANGDTTIDEIDKQRNLQVKLTWKEGFGTAYNVKWYMWNNGDLVELSDFDNKLDPKYSMMEKIWVDNNNILHYNIKQKYSIDNQNNAFIVKITTITGEEYEFTKEILFLKDGDQGTNGTTYIVAIRPYDTTEQDIRLSGFQPLTYKNGKWSNLPLRCYVYRDGQLINNSENFEIGYEWFGINIKIIEETRDKIIVTRQLPLDKEGKELPEKNFFSTDQEELAEAINANYLQTFVKVQVSIKKNKNDNDEESTRVYASYPIDLAIGNNINNTLVHIGSIPTHIKYTSSGVQPEVANNSIECVYNNSKKEIRTLDSELLKLEQLNKEENIYQLRPVSYFIYQGKDNSESNIGVLQGIIKDKSQFIVRTIIMYLDTFGNEAINGWDGTALKTEDGYLFAPQVGAGAKDGDNKFTGVVMGKDSGQKQIGLYGYKKGATTFGLKEDGTAFFGSAKGGGRIIIDGTEATIYGGGNTEDKNQSGGESSSGMTIKLANLFPTDPKDENYKNPAKISAIKLAKGIFQVNYDGSLIATSATINGKIYAESGKIGGSNKKSDNNGWIIETNLIKSGSNDSTIALSSNPDSYFRIWAGKSKAAKTQTDSDGEEKEAIATDGNQEEYSFLSYRKFKKENGDKTIIYRLKQDDEKTFEQLPLNERIDTPAPFVVTKDGFVCMKDAYIKGRIETTEGNIGGWIIDKDRIISDNGKTGMASGGIISVGDGERKSWPFRFWSGTNFIYNKEHKNWEPESSRYFYVDSDGKLYCKEAEIQGAISSSTINGGSITIGENFIVNTSGELKANSAEISGKIIANSGKIGDWSITDGKIQSGDNNSVILDAINGSISGATISGGNISIGNGRFVVNSEGDIKIKNFNNDIIFRVQGGEKDNKPRGLVETPLLWMLYSQDIPIEDNSVIADHFGYIGPFKNTGTDMGEDKNTYSLCLKTYEDASKHPSIILESCKNIVLRGATGDPKNPPPPGKHQLWVVNIPANDQHGIYARFA